jgi:trimeric autotransporter adhesin
VVFPHTYTNTGNGSDTVTITLGSATANFTLSAIYMDANGDGVPDNTTNIAGNTFTLAANQVLKVVVVGTLSTSAVVGTAETIKLTAVSGGAGVVGGNPNTDSIMPTKNAAIAVTKSMSASSGVGGNVVGVTLTYTNTGNATATAVVIADPLGSTGIQATSTTFVYQAPSGKLNGATLTDGSGGWIVASNTPTLTIASVAPGVTGTITFNVTVGASAAIGGTINNTANFMYNDSVSQIPGAGTINTNTVPFTIQQNAAVTWTAGDAGFTAGNPATDNLGAQTYNQGGVITFTDTVTNSGNGFDTLNITYNGSTFPPGTTFQFFRSDGLTPLTDSNGDGIIDVGPVAAGGTATIKVKAILPAGTTTGAAWFVNVVATSTASTANNFATAIATVKDEVTATLTTSTVDLTITAPALGAGPVGVGSGKASGFTQTVNPGAQVIFPFYVQNTSSQTATADSYSLLVQTTASTGNVTVASLSPNSSVVPLGWTAIFHSGNCAAAPVTSTNSLTAANGTNTAGSSQLLCLELDIPAGYAGSTNNFLVQALSNSTGAIDQMQFAVVVNTVHSVAVTPNQSGQVYAGGTITYKHVITNAGNFAETVTFPAATTVVFNPALPGWTATVYQDTNLNGVLDGTDTVVVPGTTTFPLPIGGSLVVFVKVQASASANPGDSTDSTFTIQYDGGVFSSATDDISTVIVGQIKLLKSQWIDTLCTHVSPAFTTGTGSASTGQCIMYQIVATNTGTTDAANVTFTDAAPAYTTYLNTYTPTVSNTCSMTNPTVSALSGNLPFSYAFVGSMTPSCTATVTFEVKLN